MSYDEKQPVLVVTGTDLDPGNSNNPTKNTSNTLNTNQATKTSLIGFRISITMEEAFERMKKLLTRDRLAREDTEALQIILPRIVTENLDWDQFGLLLLMIHKILRPKDQLTTDLITLIDSYEIFDDGWLDHYCDLAEQSNRAETLEGSLQIAKSLELIMDLFKFMMEKKIKHDANFRKLTLFYFQFFLLKLNFYMLITYS